MDDNYNILIADDHYLVAKLIKMMLKAANGFNVIGIARDSNEILNIFEGRQVDLILLDIDMPEINGLKVLETIKKNYRDTKAIMLSNHSESWIIKKAMDLGANGYITKLADTDEVLEAINKVRHGESYFCRNSMQSLLANYSGKEEQKDIVSEIKPLSKRERQVLKLIAEEYTNKEIAELLCISIRTVETHRKNILRKTGAKNTLGLIKLTMESNLLESY